MFAAHLTAIKGAHDLSSLNDHDTTPCGSLALCAVAVSIAIEMHIAFSCLKQVEHALKLIAAGTITIDMVQKEKGKVPTFPKKINQAMGKASNQLTGFNEVTWGLQCWSYVKLTKKLTASPFDKIITLAKKYMTTPCTIESTTIIEIEEEEDDACANIVDHSSGSEPESDCESSFTLLNIGLMPIQRMQLLFT